MEPRKTKYLSSETLQRLGALGVAGSIGAASNSDGAVHYVNLGGQDVIASTFSLDLDGAFGGDVASELQFTHVFPGAGTNYFGNASAQAISSQAFIAGFQGTPSVYRYVSNPASGALIAEMNTANTQLVVDPAFDFNVISSGQQGRMAVAANPGDPDLRFMSGTEGFLAFKFRESSSGDTAFGWLRLTVAEADGGPSDTNTIKLHDFAWSTDTNISVGTVPEPSAVGLLALGAAGLSMMRRRSTSADREED